MIIKCKSGVYKLSCGTCNMVYIGQTSRTFFTRINEHKRDCLNDTGKSNYSRHLIENNHVFKFTCLFRLLRSQ